MSYPELKGKTYIVTGAGSGMGQQIAILLAKQGANVGLIDIREPENTKDAISKEGGSSLSIACDVTVAEQVNASVARVKEHFGRLDGAANMAGISETKRTKMGGFSMRTLDDEDWKDIMSVNIDGVKNCLRAEIQAIDGSGSIVSASSVGGQYGPQRASPYVASKWGVIGLTKTVAKEEGKRGLRVNAVAPGVVDTPLGKGSVLQSEAFLSGTCLGRMAQPVEIARVVVFLLSDSASFITASVVNVDGGYF